MDKLLLYALRLHIISWVGKAVSVEGSWTMGG